MEVVDQRIITNYAMCVAESIDKSSSISIFVNVILEFILAAFQLHILNDINSSVGIGSERHY